MTTGNVLYLAMTLGAFTAFSVVLAYQSWQQAKLGPDMIVDPADDADHRNISDEITA